MSPVWTGSAWLFSREEMDEHVAERCAPLVEALEKIDAMTGVPGMYDDLALAMSYRARDALRAFRERDRGTE